MQRIYVFLSLLFACIFIMNPLTAVAPQDKQDVKNDLRILELLPNLLCPLAVNPGIPADFVALSPKIKDAIPQSEIVVLDHCDHFPYIEQPSQFFSKLNKFLSKINH